MRGIYIDPNGTIATVEDTLDYDQLNKLVGGMLEGVYSQSGLPGYANEEGLYVDGGMFRNVVASIVCGHHIVGPVIFIRTDTYGDSMSVTDGDIAGLHASEKEWTVAEILAARQPITVGQLEEERIHGERVSRLDAANEVLVQEAIDAAVEAARNF